METTLLRVPAVARRLAISETSTRRLIRQRLIPAIRVGRQLRVKEEALNEWMQRGGAGGWKRHALPL
jgi:excisionase family DNA binding protein